MRIQERKRREDKDNLENRIKRIGQKSGKIMEKMKIMCKDQEIWMKWTE
jgi:hypothetical protein